MLRKIFLSSALAILASFSVCANVLFAPKLRTIVLSEVVNEDMAAKFQLAVRILEFEDNAKDCLVIINSPGGYCEAMKAIINTIKSTSMHVVTYTNSEAMSAGAYILAAGDERYAAPLSTIMIHTIGASTFGRLEVMQAAVNYYYRETMAVLSDMAKHTGIPLQKILDKLKKEGPDVFMMADEAKAFGIVHDVAYVWYDEQLGIVVKK